MNRSVFSGSTPNGAELRRLLLSEELLELPERLAQRSGELREFRTTLAGVVRTQQEGIARLRLVETEERERHEQVMAELAALRATAEREVEATANLRRMVEEESRHIAELRETVQEHSRQIAEQSRQIAELRETVHEHSRHIAEMREAIAELTAAL